MTGLATVGLYRRYTAGITYFNRNGRPHSVCFRHRRTPLISLFPMRTRCVLFVVTMALASAVPTRRALVFKFANDGNYRRALALISDAKASGSTVHPAEFTAAIGACSRARDLPAAMGALALLETDLRQGKTAPDLDHAKAYTQAMGACGRVANWEQALSLLDRMRELGLPPDTRAYNAAMSACARAGQVAPLLELRRHMTVEGVPADKATFTIAMDGCARAGMAERALELFDRMGHNGNPEPDAICYNTAIAACARGSGSAWKDALRLLKRMRDSGMPPTIEGVSSAMAACSNARHWQLTMQLFDRLPTLGLQADATAYSTALTALSRNGRYGEALRLFRRMRLERVVRDVVVYNSILHACALEVRPGLARRHATWLRRLMRAEGVRPNDITHSVLLQSLWYTPEAASILDEAMANPAGGFRRCMRVQDTDAPGVAAAGNAWTLDLHNLSPGAAVAMTVWVLSQLAVLVVSSKPLPVSVVFITGWGKHHSSWQYIGRHQGAVRGAVLEAMRVCRVPLTPESDPGGRGASSVEGYSDNDRAARGDESAPSSVTGASPTPGAAPASHRPNPGLVTIELRHFRRWVREAVATGLMRGYFGQSDRLSDRLLIDLTASVAAIELASQAAETPARRSQRSAQGSQRRPRQRQQRP